MAGIVPLAGAISTLARIAVELPMAEHMALELACVIVKEEAKRVIGTYEYGWTPLAPSTLAKKSANTPLLETGEMRDSIEHQVIGHIGYVGSDNDKALYQELGTSRGIPPRSFLMGAAMRKEAEIHELTGRYFYAYLCSGLGIGHSHFDPRTSGRVTGGAMPLDYHAGVLAGRIRP
jgi:hypothetical protein